MKKLNMVSATNRYNDLMDMVGHEYLTIGTKWSEDYVANWNLRDMVAEIDYTLSCYYEDGHCFEEMRHSYDEEERKMWRSETGKLRRFIEAYTPFIKDMKCNDGHCSRFDN